MTNKLVQIRNEVKMHNPLIHCITNHITANDCANMILAVGAAPIMAEHPKESAEITQLANALAVNLGGISDVKMESMRVSGETAANLGIPSVIDLVGVACSTLRLDFAREYISLFRPNVIKGNVSEVKAICGVENNASGIDAGSGDAVTDNNIESITEMMREFSERTGAVVIVTGAMDIIVYKAEAYTVKNGCKGLSQICGTGCMLNALTASFISSGQILEGCLLAVILMGICGELSENESGPGSFKTLLFDNIYSINDSVFTQRIRLSKIMFKSRR